MMRETTVLDSFKSLLRLFFAALALLGLLEPHLFTYLFPFALTLPCPLFAIPTPLSSRCCRMRSTCASILTISAKEVVGVA